MSRDQDSSPQAEPRAARPSRGRVRRVVAWVVAMLVVGVCGFVAFAWRLALSEVSTRSKEARNRITGLSWMCVTIRSPRRDLAARNGDGHR
jgi:hypothetical protein